eukprot:CAMPEP_0184487928 /NCGR_PEP_ID=MMETSP0113_2-20130426/10420_1 /TAXON_ID=91329 /ORGANISM="Norrisiella sphaerica, Strain BC52" /LENGTH=514 /DNA_ID=CAMNT_0026870365 /DNA_START=245 /DNA_END=1789 /DNA_ORIENTATION=-
MAKRKARSSGSVKPKRIKKKNKEERRLEQALFGTAGTEDIEENVSEDQPGLDDNSAVAGVSENTDKGLFALEEEIGGRGAHEGEETATEAKLEPAWVDKHDEQVEVSVASVSRLRKLRKNEKEKKLLGTEYVERLREKFREIHRSDNSWAALTMTEKEEDLILQRSSGMLVSGIAGNPRKLSSSALSAKEINVTRMKDANIEAPSEAVVRSTRFHPNGQVLMTAGFDKTVRLFQIDGTRNPKLLSVTFDGFPIYTAEFTGDGAEVFCSSRRQHLYNINVSTGQTTRIPGIKGRRDKSYETFAMQPGDGAKYIAVAGTGGNLLVLSQRTKQHLFSLKANAPIVNCAFPDAQNGQTHEFRTICSNGEVYTFDARTRRCLSRHSDEGSVKGTAIACTSDGSLYACGSSSGVANIYDAKAGITNRPKPLKSILNLTTQLDVLRFNADGQLLAIASSRGKEALRLIHLSSKTVFANWPTFQTPLNYVSTVDFSPNSGFFAIGNAKGKVLLYRLNHFHSA